MLTQNNTRFFPVCFTIFLCSEESRKKKSDRNAFCDGGQRTRLLLYRRKHLHGAGIYEKDFNFHKKCHLRLTKEMACDKIIFVSIFENHRIFCCPAGRLFLQRKDSVQPMKKSSLSFVFVSLLVLFACSFSSLAASQSIPAEKVKITSFSSTASSITLSWKKVDNAVGYKVYEATDKGGVLVKKTNECSATVTGYSPDTTHIFRVRAYTKDKDGNTVNGILSDTVTVRTKLADIRDLSFAAASETAVKVSWSKVAKAAYYKIAIAPFGSSDYKNVGQTEKCEFTVRGLSGKSGYKIRVVAVGKGNRSEYARIPLYTRPSVVTGFKATKTTYNSATLQWNKMPCTNKYYVYVCSTKDGKYALAGTTGKTSLTVKLSKTETKYYFKIRAAAETEYQKTVGSAGNAVAATTKAYPFTIKLSSASVRKGEYLYLSVPHYKNIKWTSSNPTVISLSGSRAYAGATGSATVTAESAGKKTSVKITVGAAVTNYMACVYDYTAGKWVFSNRLNERCYPASITKLITALVALKYMSVNDTIVVGNELNMVEAMSSRCGILKGEKFRLGDLLYGLLLPSGGDAAYTIAVNCARKVAGRPNMGYVEAKNYFVSLMNSYMKSIGATGTHCVNPHGYPVNGHYSTVHDLVLVAKQVLQNPTLKTVTSTQAKYITALTGKGRSWRSTNQLLNRSSGFYSPYAHGMKTGTVNDNYTGIVSAATKNGRTIITVAIGCESFNARYNATHRLYNAYL